MRRCGLGRLRLLPFQLDRCGRRPARIPLLLRLLQLLLRLLQLRHHRVHHLSLQVAGRVAGVGCGGRGALQ